MLKASWLKSIKAALLAGLIGLLGFGAEAEELIAYYKAGYIGDHASSATDALKLTATSGGSDLAYTSAHGEWTLIIDSNSPKGAQAWCANTVKYNDFVFTIAKVIIKRDFTLKPGVTAALFDAVEIEVEEGAKLTLTNEGSRTMSLGAVTFSGDGEVDASSGVTFTKPITTKGNVTVKTPANAFVATVDGTEYLTITDAFYAAKPSGTICVTASTWPTTNLPEGIKDAAQWQGTVTFSGTMPNGFAPANYGNANSTIEFKGVSEGYLANKGSFDGTLKVTNADASTPGWQIDIGYSDDNFVFGALTGDGDIVAGDSSVTQQYSFKDALTFLGSMTTSSKRLVVGETTHGSRSQYTSRIYIEKGHVVRIAEGKTLSGKWGMIVDGEIKGSGTLACPSDKKVIFGFANDAAPTIDLAEGVPQIAEGCAVQFNKPLTLKNVQPGDTILKCASKPTNLETVTLKDESGATPSLWSLKYENGAVKLSGGIKKLSGNESWIVDAATAADFPTPLILDLSDYYGEGAGKPVGETAHTVMTFPVGTEASAYLSKIQVVYPTLHAAGSLSAEGNKIFFTFGHLDLYWNAWRGTFWEAVFGGDIHGNNGFGRTEAGATQAILAGDTVIFDKEHYQVAGEFAEKSPYWHYDENLYIKDEVNPGTNNDWDLKVLEGVTLKMGLRGARATGQNIITDFKIYVEENSTLELGYWGNTHHYQGVIRPDVTFGGAGTITLGDDMGASCRIEGNLKVKQDPSAQETEVPTLNVRGKELVVQGGQIDVNLTGFGALSGSGTITTPITFNNATINATDANGFTFKNKTTFTGTLTVDMTSAPTGEDLVKICTKGEGGSFVFANDIDVLVRVGGSVQPAFYTLATDTDGNLCVKVATVQITYDAEVVLGYDYKTMICRVTMTPAIEGVVATVTVNEVADNLRTWTAPVIGMRGSGRCEVMVGDADDNFAPGTYSMTVSVGGWTSDELPFTLAPSNDGNLAMVDGFGYKTMREAVAASQESGKGIDLLTNVFFAAPEGTYAIDRNGFDVKATNYTTIDAQTNEVTAEDEVVLTRDGKGITRVVIAGDWLAAGLPWRTKKTIDAAIWTTGETMAPFEAYVLGFDSEDALTAKVIVRGVQTADPKTIELTDDLSIKSAAETGVVVTKKLVDANDGKTVVSETTTYDLTQMTNKSALLKLSYAFAHDKGQE